MSHKVVWLIVSVVVLVTGACVSLLDKQVRRAPSSDFNYSNAYNYERFFDRSESASLDCDQFFQILNTEPKPGSTLAALNVLKAKKPKIFSRYVLLPNSLSIQKSSWINPRALIFSGDGQMVLTFIGDNKQDGYRGLELMCFQKQTSTFEFREVVFPKESTHLDLSDLTETQKKLPFVISPPNGFANTTHDCRMCHQEILRPNWDSYPIWPSSYGAVDDALTAPFILEHAPAETVMARYTRAEAEKFGSFKLAGRYAALEKNAFARPNLAFGKVLSILNSERIVAQLKRLGPSFTAKKMEFAKALYCPLTELDATKYKANMFDLVPPFLEPVDPNIKDIFQSIDLAREAKASRLKENLGIDVKPHEDLLNGGPLRSVMEWESVIRLARIEKIVSPLGIDIKNWSMVLNGGYDMEDGSSSSNGPAFALALDVPFLNTFFPNDSGLINLVMKRRFDPNSTKSWPQRLSEDTAICEHLNK